MRDETTFMFADLAGFTAMIEAHGDEPAADLAEEFSRLVRELLPAYRAEEIKLIGDAIMLRIPAADNAVRLGLQIVCEVGLRHGAPAVRVGMHTGPAVARAGDWYGATVNLAARVASVAGGGEVLLTDTTRRSAGSPAGVQFESRGSRRFKNVGEPVALHAAEPDDPSSKRDGRSIPSAGWRSIPLVEQACPTTIASSASARPSASARSSARPTNTPERQQHDLSRPIGLEPRAETPSRWARVKQVQVLGGCTLE